jgi:hypothetical protein
MGLLRLARRAPREQPSPPERPEVTEYRDFLLSAPHELLVSVHRQALPGLDLFVRAVIRNTARELTGSDTDVPPEDTVGLTDLLLAGGGAERVALLEAYDDGVRHRLAHAVAVVLRPPEEPAPPEPEPDPRPASEDASAVTPLHEPRTVGSLLA